MSTDSRAAAASNHDELTSAMSRRSFVFRLQAAKVGADRDGSGFVLCLADVDQLRGVNDRHGQHVGDSVLTELASRAVGLLQSPEWHAANGLVARFDGDGLMFMLERSSALAGERFAEEFRRRITAEPFARDLRVTASLGVATYRSGESIDELLARTEKALHLAKQFGRDRVETARTPEPRGRSASVTPIVRGARD